MATFHTENAEPIAFFLFLLENFFDFKLLNYTEKKKKRIKYVQPWLAAATAAVIITKTPIKTLHLDIMFVHHTKSIFILFLFPLIFSQLLATLLCGKIVVRKWWRFHNFLC